jgi:hypothetical protein
MNVPIAIISSPREAHGNVPSCCSSSWERNLDLDADFGRSGLKETSLQAICVKSTSPCRATPLGNDCRRCSLRLVGSVTARRKGDLRAEVGVEGAVALAILASCASQRSICSYSHIDRVICKLGEALLVNL